MNSTTHIHVTGKVQEASVDQLNEFAIAKEKIEAMGYENITTAADDLPSGDELNDPDAKKLYINKRNENLKKAAVVVHLMNYQDDKAALMDVRLAINDRKERVCSITRFMELYKKKEAVS